MLNPEMTKSYDNTHLSGCRKTKPNGRVSGPVSVLLFFAFDFLSSASIMVASIQYCLENDMHRTVKAVTLSSVLALFLICGCSSGAVSPLRFLKLHKQSEVKLDYKTFRNPPAEYRSITFWSLNDQLDPAEMKRQMALFKEGGFGGAFLHSRVGLLTEYLGPEWWQAMDAGVEAADDLGLEAWFYDEDKWPSGFAGGIVPKMSRDYHARSLVRLAKDTNIPVDSELLAEDDHYRYIDYKVKFGDPWFNGTCWVDLMNPDAIKAFIDCSYKPYAERYAKHLGGSVKGIFTDEPQISPRHVGFRSEGAVPFSRTIRKDFQDQHGYDFVDHVASIFDDGGDFRKVRLDYWRTLARRFEKSFSEQIGQYCDKTGMIWTGHYNSEEYLLPVMTNVGNMMTQYRHMQRPGIDHLGLRIEMGLIPAKSLSSIANQYGIERRLSELFGSSGQNMSFEDRKWIGDWHNLMGINSFCPHLSLYTMKGVRKRDFPPTFSYQQPYWQYNKLIEDYMARLCHVTTAGKYAPEILVISPLESAYVENTHTAREPWNTQRGRDYYSVLEALQKAHRDYDLGDEQILSEIASVENGKLRVGQMTYSAVVLPYMLTIRPSTIDLLAQFMDSNSPVIAVGEFPAYVDGCADENRLLPLHGIPMTRDAAGLPRLLADALPPAVRVEGKDSEYVWIQRRSSGKGHILQVANTSRLHPIDCAVYIPDYKRKPVLWDPANGKCFKLKANDANALELHLAPAQSLVVTTSTASKTARAKKLYSRPQQGSTIMELAGPWCANRLDLNAITLDFARYSTDSGKTFSRAEPVLGIHKRFEQTQFSGPLVLAFNVQVDIAPSQCGLVIEQPEMYTSVAVNGTPVSFADSSFYCDQTFRKTNVTSLLKVGKNEIVLKLDYVAPVPDSFDARTRYGTEIESIYLVGDFAVRAVASDKDPAPTERNSKGFLTQQKLHRFRSFSLTAENALLEGDLTPQGYPFYAGRFELSRSFDFADPNKDSRYFLTLPNIEATVVLAELNSKRLAPVAWSPWEVEITDALKTGTNELKLTLVNTLRNLLGPHHHRDGELTSVGEDSFGGRTTWTGGGPGDRDWYDVRLMQEPKIWRDDYHHIPFGLLSPPVIVAR